MAVRTEHSVSRRSIFWVHYVSTSTLGHTVSSWRSPTRPLHGVTEWSAAPQIPPLVRSRAAAAAGRKRSAWCCYWRVPTEGTGGGGVDVPSGVLQWRWPLDEQPAGDGAPGSSITLLRRVHAAAGRERTDAWGVAGGSSLCRGPAGGAALLFGCGSGDSRRVRRRHDGRRRKSHHLLREERQRPPLFSPRHTHTRCTAPSSTTDRRLLARRAAPCRRVVLHTPRREQEESVDDVGDGDRLDGSVDG